MRDALRFLGTLALFCVVLYLSAYIIAVTG